MTSPSESILGPYPATGAEVQSATISLDHLRVGSCGTPQASHLQSFPFTDVKALAGTGDWTPSTPMDPPSRDDLVIVAPHLNDGFYPARWRLIGNGENTLAAVTVDPIAFEICQYVGVRGELRLHGIEPKMIAELLMVSVRRRDVVELRAVELDAEQVATFSNNLRPGDFILVASLRKNRTDPIKTYPARVIHKANAAFLKGR